MKGDVSVRDLAHLEVTAILHHPRYVGIGIAQACADLYGQFVSVPSSFDPGNGPDLLRNTRALVAQIRRRVVSTDSGIYALMVFDVAHQQLGGLTFDASRNKISEPREVAFLASLATGWYRRHAGGGQEGGPLAKAAPRGALT